MEHTENKTIIHDTEKTASWEQQTAMKVSGISILVNLLLSVFKLIAGIVAHSGAMISDAIHSASDVGSTFIVIIGVRLSTKKSDKEHQYGHERMECVSSIVLAGMLLVTGLGIGITGARDIVKSTSGGTIAIPGTLALIAAVVSIVVKRVDVLVYKRCCKEDQFRSPDGRCMAPSFRCTFLYRSVCRYFRCKTGIPDPGPDRQYRDLRYDSPRHRSTFSGMPLTRW